jgi:membrane protein DedA with SNARE-associated domain
MFAVSAVAGWRCSESREESTVLALTEWATDAISTGGPLVLMVVMFLENVFPPIPSEAVLPLAGYLVSQGTLNPVVAVVAATIGSTLGAFFLYEVGRYGGRPLVLRYGRVFRIDEDRLDRADAWMDRHGTKVVFAARMVPLARSVVSIPAGTTRMGRGQFLAYSALGSLVWNAALIGAGWALGETWKQASDVVGLLSTIAAAAAVVGLLVLWWRVQRSRRRAREGGVDTDTDTSADDQLMRSRTTATVAPTSRATAPESTEKSPSR